MHLYFIPEPPLLVGAICLGAEEKKAIPKRTEKTTGQPVEKAGAETRAKLSERAPASQLLTEQQTADGKAIRQRNDSFVKAYEQADARAIAARFAVNAEYVDELGNVFQDREEIEAAMTAFFAENPDCKLKMNIESIRFISPGVAVEDGTSLIKQK
jgi:ketosteroid isomerase-like protein